MTKLLVYDTTLRNGMPGESDAPAAMLKIANQLDEAGIHLIDGGWPGINESSKKFFECAHNVDFKNAKLVACSLLRSPNVTCGNDKDIMRVLKSDAPVVNVFGSLGNTKTMELAGISKDRYMIMVAETVCFFKRNGRSVIFSAEEFLCSFEKDWDYALSLIKAVVNSGADCIILCNSNAECLAERAMEAYQEINTHLEKLKREKKISGIPCFGVSCTIKKADIMTALAVHRGARLVEGSVLGGDNAQLTNIISIVDDRMNMESGVNLSKLKLLADAS